MIDWTRFTRKTAIKATLQDMYDAWTKALEIEKWFLKEARYTHTSGDQLHPNENFQKGDNYVWTWYNHNDKEENRIIAANGLDFISFGFAGECTVEVKLKEIEGHILVELTQFNIPTDDQSKSDIRLGCDRGWSYYLVNLKSFYENGKDLRIKEPEIHQQVYTV